MRHLLDGYDLNCDQTLRAHQPDQGRAQFLEAVVVLDRSRLGDALTSGCETEAAWLHLTPDRPTAVVVLHGRRTDDVNISGGRCRRRS